MEAPSDAERPQGQEAQDANNPEAANDDGRLRTEPIDKSRYPLNLQWTCGFNPDLAGGVHSLSDGIRHLLFYAAGHTGVIYDVDTQKQHLLQGHVNYINATAVSRSRRWVCTADAGQDSMVVVWDTMPYLTFYDDPADAVKAVQTWQLRNVLPIRSIFGAHGGAGVLSANFSSDGQYLATLGADTPQTLCVWRWQEDCTEPLRQVVVRAAGGAAQTGRHHTVKFNPCDAQALVSNGRESVLFYRWDPSDTSEQGALTCLTPFFSTKDFRQQPTGFTDTVYVGRATIAVTGTLDGDLVVWDNRSLSNLSQQLEPGHYTVTKVVRVLAGSPVNVVATLGDAQIVTGGEDGTLKVFDSTFRLVHWVEKHKMGPIASVSFSGNVFGATATLTLADADSLPECVLATRHGRVLRVRRGPAFSGDRAREKGLATEVPVNADGSAAAGVNSSEVQVLLQAPFGRTGGAVVHPQRNEFTIGSANGILQLWDYATRRMIGARKFESSHEVETYDEVQRRRRREITVNTLQITALAYSADGAFLAVGFGNGSFRVIHSHSLQDVPHFALTVSEHAIERVVFDDSASYLALADAKQNIAIVEKSWIQVQADHLSLDSNGEPVRQSVMSWSLLGKTRAHALPVTGLAFIPPSPLAASPSLRLASVSLDRHLTVFDITASRSTTGLAVVHRARIEQSARPTCLLVLPANALLGDDQSVHEETQHFMVVATSEHKLKVYNTSTFLCRRTVMAPVHRGGEVTKLATIPRLPGYLAYATRGHVTGLIKLPLDGNPHRHAGLVAHPDAIQSLGASSDGRLLLTASAEKACVNVWELNPGAIEAQFQLRGRGLAPFLDLLDPSGAGEAGAVYKELEEFFYYAQLRRQGEDVKDDREISDTVDVSQIPGLMQAMGFYPTLAQATDMMNEVKYARAEASSELCASISLPELVKLYVNHRPESELAESDLLDALAKVRVVDSVLSGRLGRDEKAVDNAQPISRAALLAALQQTGEPMDPEELDTSLRTLHSLLCPPAASTAAEPPESFQPEEFITNVLGFEAVEPDFVQNKASAGLDAAELARAVVSSGSAVGSTKASRQATPLGDLRSSADA